MERDQKQQIKSDTGILIFSVQTRLVKPKAMEPFTPVALRGPVPIPPQRTNKAANSVGTGNNPPKHASALPPSVINSVSANQTKPGNEETMNKSRKCVCQRVF